MHLSKFFGSTIQEIKKYSNEIIILKNKPIKDSVKNRLSVITNTINNMSKQIIKKKTKSSFCFRRQGRSFRSCYCCTTS